MNDTDQLDMAESGEPSPLLALIEHITAAMAEQIERKDRMLAAQAKEIAALRDRLHDAEFQKLAPFSWSGEPLMHESRKKGTPIRAMRYAITNRTERELIDHIGDSPGYHESVKWDALQRLVKGLDERGFVVCETVDHGPYVTRDYHIDVAKLGSA